MNDQPEVRDSCVFGVQTPHGPEPMAVIMLREATADPAEIIRRANTKLNVSQHIRQWRVWDEADFPRTSTHKVRKGRVREQALADQQPKQAKLTKSETLSDLISGVSGLNADSLRDETRLSSDLNLDSLGRVALLGALEDRYQVEIDESAITSETTVADIEKMISERSETRKPVQQTLGDYPYPRWALRWPVRWLRWIAYYLLVVPFLVVMCRPKVRGRERLQALSGPALFVANHISMVDPAMIMWALPIRFRHRLAIAMAGERLRAIRQSRDAENRFLRLFDPIRYLLVVIVFNVFPLPQKSGFRRSFAYAGEAMDKGYSVLVFPEGRTTQDGRMNPFMSGTGLLAENLNVPVVPIRIEGLFNLKAEKRYFSPPGTVTVTIGEPVVFEKGTDPAEITKRLEQAVRDL
ncbi:MAG: 1-acyl-sn-glycerol-3-phosphate acyltransferase [Acidobacteria bacterium]|nr:1-acyl-sn-glycerol-3-phosphate acyltransferase [Acidobacteriota bacterium]